MFGTLSCFRLGDKFGRRRTIVHGAAVDVEAWLGLVGPGLWWAFGISLLYALIVFRTV